MVLEVVNVALACELLELFPEVLLVCNDILIIRLVVFTLEATLESGGVRDILDGEGSLVILLKRHLVERESGDGGIRILIFLGHEDNKVADVLFEFGQVESHVVLVELGAFVVLHWRGDGQVEV